MLSKLTQRSLYAGYRSLNKIEECIQHKAHAKDIEQYCSEFYKNIPHNSNSNPILTIETIKIKKQEILTMIQINAQNEVEEAFRKQNK
jgi:hypothetical protein